MDEATSPETLVDVLRARADTDPDAIAFRHRSGSGWRAVAWREVRRRVDALAAGFLDAGLQRGDRVALMASTSLDWAITAFAVWTAGGTLVTIYPSTTAPQLRFLLNDSVARILIVADDGQRAAFEEIRAEVPGVGRVLQMGGGADGGAPLADLEAQGRRVLADDPDFLLEVTEDHGPDDLACLVYTSGTTGEPKGAMLGQDNLVAVVQGTSAWIPMEPGDEQYLFLPLSHVYGLLCLLVAVHVGAPTALDGDVDAIPDNLRTLKPTFMPAVPRVFEKILEAARTRAAERSGIARRVFEVSLDVAAWWSDRVRADRAVPASLMAAHAVADRLVYRKLREGLGGRIRAFASGGAPLRPDVAAVFHAAGLPIIEGYGLTETGAISVANRLDHWRLGTVGTPGPGIELRLAEDGEIQLRGPSVMRGYWNRPDATAEVLAPDGWFSTGDIGHVDDDGFLVITDRKKNILVTAGGKNVPPAPLEARLRAASPLVVEAMVLGDGRKFLSALVWVEPAAVAAFLREAGVEPGVDAHRHPKVQAALDGALEATNEGLASYETIKKLHVVPHEPDEARGELTPSLKLRRKAVEARYASQIDALYR